MPYGPFLLYFRWLSAAVKLPSRDRYAAYLILIFYFWVDIADDFLLILPFCRCFYSLGKFPVGNSAVQLFKDHILIF